MNHKYQSNSLIRATKTIIITLLVLVSLSIQCQEGSLDTTFNSAGIQPGVVITPIGMNRADSFSIVIQADGKIIAGGTDTANFVLARYLTNGLLDTTFNNQGLQPGVVVTQIGNSTSSKVNAMVLQPDGKIIAAGTDTSNFVLARYLSNGSLDTTFNSTGSQPGLVITQIGSSPISSINAVALQLDGKIVAAGTDGFNFTLARYLPDGSLDTTFNSAGSQPGVVVTPVAGTINMFNAVAIQVDGKIVAIGTDGLNFVLARYSIDGILDITFNSLGTQPGIIVTPIEEGAFAFAGAIQANGKIIAAGVTLVSGNENFALARYLTDGSLDTTFGGTGIVITPNDNVGSFAANALTVQSDGKIIAAGLFTSDEGNEQFALARYTINGSLDSTFGIDGIVTTPIETNAVISGMALQVDGKIVVAGAASMNVIGNGSFALARYIAMPPLNPTIILPPTSFLNQPITLSGTAQNESIITLIIDGVVTNLSIATRINASGDEVDTTGFWSLVIPLLSPGRHTIIASASYKTGNVILLSAPIEFCVTIPSITLLATCAPISRCNPIELIATPMGGVPPYQIVYSDGIMENDVTGPTIRTICPDVKISVIAIDSNGCQSNPTNPRSALSQAIFQKYCLSTV